MTNGRPDKLSHLKVVKPPVDHDTVACLERLLGEAKAGKVIGLAFVALMPKRHFIKHTTGAVHQERVYTRGLLQELDDMIREQRD
jgi:hypothetical protein